MSPAVAILTRHDPKLGQLVHRELHKRFKTMDGIKLELSDRRDAREAEALRRYEHRKHLEAAFAKIDAMYSNRPKEGDCCPWPREGWASRVSIRDPEMTAYQAARYEDYRRWCFDDNCKAVNKWQWLKRQEAKCS